jgi:hypothetical protein
MHPETKNCQNCKSDFTIASEDFAFYEKIGVPAPTFCPECRLIRRLVWRNERSLYKRVCDLCDKSIIAMYDKDAAFPVYCPECWRSDNWDPMEYGCEYDFNKTFFAQFRELMNKVPRAALAKNGNNINAEYSNIVQDVKNVYLSSSVIWGSEDVYYSSQVDKSKNIIDSLATSHSENSYENVNDVKNYNCFYTYFSESCIDSRFLYNCSNCQDCFGCVNMRNKSYCIWNEQYTKEEYKEKIKQMWDGNYTTVKAAQERFEEFVLDFPCKYARLVNCVDSTGDELKNTKNVHVAFNSFECENSKFLYRCLGPGLKDCYDAAHLGRSELIYEHAQGGSDQSSNLKFISYGRPAQARNEYCDYCGSSSDLFACIGLQNKQYCVFNKQYSKEEYDALVQKIKVQMSAMPYIDANGREYRYGEFFPMELSPFSYNETVANEHFPKTKDEAIQQGFSWKDKEDNQYNITIQAYDLPNNINNVDDSILNEVIGCAETGKAFKIIQPELQFYRQMNIPLPRLHPDVRYHHRLEKRNPLKLFKRTTTDGVEVMTPYAPDRPEQIYSEKGYQDLIL